MKSCAAESIAVAPPSRLRVLSFTTLHPNPAETFRGLFVNYRNRELARLCQLEVVAPVSLVRRPQDLRKIPRSVACEGFRVHHPRFAVVPGLLKHWDGWLLYAQTLAQLGATLARRPCDVVDVHYAYPDGAAGRLLARRMRRPYVITLHGSDLNVLTRYPRRRRLIQQVLREASALIAVSDALRDKAAELGADPRRIELIPNGVDTARFHPKSRREARARLGWPSHARVILSIGRLTAVKGFDLLINGIKLLKESGAGDIRCQIVGDGELRPALLAQLRRLGLEREVMLAGWVAPSELPDWYAAADAFCLTSRSEGCPTVLVEAMACGTPVVATAVGGIPSMLSGGLNGVLIRQRDPRDVAEALSQALATAWEPGVIARSAPVIDWSQVAARSAQVLARAAQRGPGP